jgi:NADPH:quinone reductase-like Zn-dependent oxidoreductase
VLIAIDTAGVGSWDADMRAGWSPSGRTRFPLILGTDGAGRIAALGSRIRRFEVDDIVYFYSFDSPKGGLYSEYAAVAAEKVAHIPKGLDLEHAGVIPTTGLTALQGIDDALHVKNGEAMIIHGAAGGVGTLAVQFAKLRGARVLAVTAPVDSFIGAPAPDRPLPLRWIDAVLALAGGEALERAIDAVRSGGRVAYPNGVEPEPKKRSGIRFIPYDTVAGVREFEHVGRAVEQAKLEVPIAAAHRLADAVKAHERLAQGHVLGKIVLRVRE